LHGQQRSIREIARTLAISRNTVRKYLRTPGLPAMKPRPPRPSKLDAFRDLVHRRLGEGIENCVVLLRELRAQGYRGGYSILKDHVRPRRLRRAVKATMRFETKPGETLRPETFDDRCWSASRVRRRRPTIVGVRPSAVPNFAQSLIVVARRGFSDAVQAGCVL